MERETSSCSEKDPQEASNYDEIFMQQSLIFAESLKDLRNLRKQLYSAAEYFELSYSKDDHKQLVVETLKDYVTNALINTVDHLGSMAYKVNNFLDEKVDQVSGTEIRFMCIEQRLQSSQEFVDRSGLSEQSLAMKIPRYHKHYIIPVGETVNAIGKTKPIYNGCSLSAEENSHQYSKKGSTLLLSPLQSTSNTCSFHSTKTMEETYSSLIRQARSRLPSKESSPIPGNFSFTRIASNKELEKRAVSPRRSPLQRAGSFISRSISPNYFHSGALMTTPVSPNSWNAKQRYPSEPRRSVSLSINAERDKSHKTKEIELYSKKSKNLFKALLSIRKSKKDDRLYGYMDNN